MLARLIRAPVRADARVARFVRETVFVIPTLVGVALGHLLVPLLVLAGGAEPRLEAGLRRTIRVTDEVERHVGLRPARPAGATFRRARLCPPLMLRLHRLFGASTAKLRAQHPRGSCHCAAHACQASTLLCFADHAFPFHLVPLQKGCHRPYETLHILPAPSSEMSSEP